MESTLATIPTDLLRGGLALLLIGVLTYNHDERAVLTPTLTGLFLTGGLLLAVDLLAAETTYRAAIQIGSELGLNLLIILGFGVLLRTFRLLSRPHVVLLVALGVLLPTQPTLPIGAPTTFEPPLHVFALSLTTTIILVFGIELIHRGIAGARPNTDSPPLAAAFGKHVPVSDLHTEQSGFIFYRDDRPTLGGPSTERLGDYHHWRNTTVDVPNLSSLADLTADLYLDDYAAARDDLKPQSPQVEHLRDWLQWLPSQDAVWVTNGPPFEQLLLIALVVTLIIGNPLLFLLF